MRYTLFLTLLVFSFNSFAQSNWTEIKSKELPDTIPSFILSNYAKYEIVKSTQKENKEGKLIYRIDIQKKKKLYHLVFSKQGVLLDKTKSKTFEFDGSEKKRRPGSEGDLEPPRMPSM